MNSLPMKLKLLKALVFAAIPLAAFLAFSIQPMMGKFLLPIHGGTSGTWLGCMVYFQIALLLGYLWAAKLVRKPPGYQARATLWLGVAAVATFHLPTGSSDGTPSIARVVWMLACASLPAMILLFSASPLLHGWLRRRGEEVPYYLYAISNTGSLAAVLLYPFVIEPALGLSAQRLFWHGLLLLVAVILAAAGYLLQNTARHTPADQSAEPSETLQPRQVALWLWLSALTCVGMLGATYHIGAEFGATPIAWTGPFGLFLLSFMVTFSGHWKPWMSMAAIVWLAISLAGFMATKGFSGMPVNTNRAWWLLSLTASGSFLGNALLHSLRPAQRFERFYLVLAIGGVLGGLLSSTVIPYVVPQPIEFALASAALLTCGLIWLNGTRQPAPTLVTSCVVFAPVLMLGFEQSQTDTNVHVEHRRDLYGHIQIKTAVGHHVMLLSDTTTHGTQLTTNAAHRRYPTQYYTESTGVGRVLDKFQAARPQLNVGVVGLGSGTLAAYARPDDIYDFWDIDPKSIRVALENFTFVAESAGHIYVNKRDGRKALEESAVDYDLLVIDAFTGDGIPAHLITSEAIAIYLRRLAARDGLLLVHATSRYSKLFPVIEATARSLGHSCLEVVTNINGPGQDRDRDPAMSRYVIVCPTAKLHDIQSWFATEEDNGNVHHQLNTSGSLLPGLIWSDDRNAAIDALDLNRFFF